MPVLACYARRLQTVPITPTPLIHLSSGVLDPQGPVAAAQLSILSNATVIMAAVVVPIMLLAPALAWWFRAGNRKARHRPDFSYSGPLEIVTWSIPLLVIIFLGGVAWLGAHDLDPRKPLASDQPTLDIQVVSMDWKWLFIQPAAGVASVNRLVVPAGVPLRFILTSATVMNSFFVPQLGSQLYTMPRMTTQLHLMADKPGTYPGFSAQFSGDGFSDMRFELVAMAPADYRRWIEDTRSSAPSLTRAAYDQLSEPGIHIRQARFGSIDEGLFEHIATGGDGASVCRAAVPRRSAALPAWAVAGAVR